MTTLSATRKYSAIERALVERASETLLTWAHYYLACDQDRLFTIDEDPVEAVAALRCQLSLLEAATRRARHLLALGTATACTPALDGEGDAHVQRDGAASLHRCTAYP